MDGWIVSNLLTIKTGGKPNIPNSNTTYFHVPFNIILSRKFRVNLEKILSINICLAFQSIKRIIFLLTLVGIPYGACLHLNNNEKKKYLDSRFSEVEDLLGIPTYNAVSDWVIFSVCGLREEIVKQFLENHKATST